MFTDLHIAAYISDLFFHRVTHLYVHMSSYCLVPLVSTVILTSPVVLANFIFWDW